MVGHEKTSSGKRSPAASQVLDRLTQDIASGHFAPGARLTTAALGARYGTSAMPIRAALQVLEARGFVVSTPNQGARVRPVDSDYVDELYELRCALISLLLPKCVRFITNDDLERIAGIQAAFEAAVADGDLAEAMHRNASFHRAIYALGRNGQALDVMERTWLQLDALRARYGFGPGRLGESTDGHRRLIAALAQRDAAAAVAIAIDYAGRARRDLIACIAGDGA
jgi:DNA-binding GntR family transcriptional regulator